HGGGHARDWNFLARLAHVHGHDHAQVVIGGNGAVHHADDGQSYKPGLQRRAEDVEFRKKPAGNGDTDQRKQKDSEHGGESGSAAAEAGVVVQGDVALADIGEVADHQERARVHHRVGGGVEDCRGDSNFFGGGKGHQQVARVRDGRIGQQPLHVGLHQGADVAQGHGERGGDPDEPEPAGGGGSKQDAQQ